MDDLQLAVKQWDGRDDRRPFIRPILAFAKSYWGSLLVSQERPTEALGQLEAARKTLCQYVRDEWKSQEDCMAVPGTTSPVLDGILLRNSSAISWQYGVILADIGGANLKLKRLVVAEQHLRLAKKVVSTLVEEGGTEPIIGLSAKILHQLGIVAMIQRRTPEGSQLLKESIDLYRRVGAAVNTSQSLAYDYAVALLGVAKVYLYIDKDAVSCASICKEALLVLSGQKESGATDLAAEVEKLLSKCSKVTK